MPKPGIFARPFEEIPRVIDDGFAMAQRNPPLPAPSGTGSMAIKGAVSENLQLVGPRVASTIGFRVASGTL